MGGRRRWGLKKQRRLLLGLSPVPCLLAVNLISEEKYTLCLYNAGLCLWSASEPSTILEIVSSLLKCFQTVTVEPVSFPVNCLASFPILGLSWASSESKGFLIGITMPRLVLSSLHMELSISDLRQQKHMCFIVSSSSPVQFSPLPVSQSSCPRDFGEDHKLVQVWPHTLTSAQYHCSI